VDGIGPRLKDRIVRYCFRGDLRDLRYAERVPGVGPARRAAIMRWVRARESELPRLIKGPFPGKEQVQERYRAQMAPLERWLDRAYTELEEKEALYESVETAVRRLRSVRVSNFRKALRPGSSGQPVPKWYLEGLYPAWESPPDWFITLLSSYGG